MTYDEALTILMLGSSGELWDMRDAARRVIVYNVYCHTREAYNMSDLYDWIVRGDFSPADMQRKEVFSAETLAAQWDARVRKSRDL